MLQAAELGSANRIMTVTQLEFQGVMLAKSAPGRGERLIFSGLNCHIITYVNDAISFVSHGLELKFVTTETAMLRSVLIYEV